MPKSIHRHEHEVLIDLLRKRRVEAELTQAQASVSLERSQSFISDVENGTRRLDLVQLRDLCVVYKIGLVELITEFENAVSSRRKRGTRRS